MQLPEKISIFCSYEWILVWAVSEKIIKSLVCSVFLSLGSVSCKGRTKISVYTYTYAVELQRIQKTNVVWRKPVVFLFGTYWSRSLGYSYILLLLYFSHIFFMVSMNYISIVLSIFVFICRHAYISFRKWILYWCYES